MRGAVDEVAERDVGMAVTIEIGDQAVAGAERGEKLRLRRGGTKREQAVELAAVGA